MTTQEIILSILKFLGQASIVIVPSIISALVATWMRKRELKSEDKKVETDTGKVSAGYNQLVGDLNEQIEALRVELASTKKEFKDQMEALRQKAEHCSRKIGRLQTGVVALTEQLKQAGLVPVYNVSPEDLKTDNGIS